MEDNNQRKAVMFDSGPALILAGPGSGKTYVITHHIEHLIKSGVSPDNILVITFTRKAASEMKERFRLISPYSFNRVTFGTFHSVFYQILKSFSDNVPKIISQDKHDQLFQDLAGNKDTADYFSRLISLKKSDINGNIAFSSEEEKEEFERLFSSYEDVLKSNGECDFDDIILLCKELLNNENILLKIRTIFKHILIDEFQDINTVQYETVKMICGASGIIYAVGDENQSIYGFRGASPFIFQKFSGDYPALKVITLINNYRSSKSIIDFADKVISHNTQRINYDKQNCIKNYKDSFSIRVLKNQEEMLSMVVSDLHNVSKDKSVAVLFRTNKEMNYFSHIIDNRMTENTEQKIMEEINKTVVCYGNYCLCPNNKNLKRIINSPNRNIPTGLLNDCNDFDSIIMRFAGTGISDTLYSLNSQLTVLKRLKPSSFMIYLSDIMGLRDFFVKEYGPVYENIVMEVFTNHKLKAKEFSNLNDFIAYLSDCSEIKPAKNKTEANISLLTYHQSKGLEFDVALIPNVYEGRVPCAMSVEGCSIEEERRLFYVAATRAREKLIIYTIKNEESNSVLPSRFITEFI